MEIFLDPRQEKQLRALAHEAGKPVEVLAGELLQEAIFAHENGGKQEGGSVGEPSLQFHETATDLDLLVTSHGIKPVTRFEKLLGDFWPEDESADDFIAAVREWRREGAGEQRTE